MKGYKALTWTYRPPIQGGAPVFDGRLPCELPVVELDTSDAECASGWNFTKAPETALTIAGFWPDGWPIRLFEIEADDSAIVRGDKCRAAQITLVEEVPVIPVIEKLSKRWFPSHANVMALEQIAWYEALGRPMHDSAKVEEFLYEALSARGLNWALKMCQSAQDVWSFWTTFNAQDTRTACDAWDAWTFTWNVRDACAVWNVRDARSVWASRTSQFAQDAWDAWDALMAFASGIYRQFDIPPNKLTKGIRDAYAHGLWITSLVDENTLGWAMT